MNFINAVPKRLLPWVRRSIRNHKYEWDEQGVLHLSGAKFDNYVDSFAEDGKGWIRTKNLVTVEGATLALNTLMGNVDISALYAAPFSGNVTITTALRADTFHSTCTEISTYSEATRQEFIEATPSAGSMNNNASPVVITASAAIAAVWGWGLLTSSTKLYASAAPTQHLFAVTKYAPGESRALPASGDQLSLKWTVSLTDDGA